VVQTSINYGSGTTLNETWSMTNKNLPDGLLFSPNSYLLMKFYLLYESKVIAQDNMLALLIRSKSLGLVLDSKRVSDLTVMDCNVIYDTEILNPTLINVARLNTLNSQFLTEYGKYSDYLSKNWLEVNHIFSNIANRLSTLSFTKSTVEISPTDSIKVKLLFSGQQKLVLTKPVFNDSEISSDQIVYSLIENDEVLITDTANLSDLIRGLNAYLA
jgi:hypothetical protein